MRNFGIGNKLVVTVVALGAVLITGPASALAHPTSPHVPPPHQPPVKPPQAGKCGEVSVGYVVGGLFVSDVANSDGTSSLTVLVKRANRHALKSGVTVGSTTTVVLSPSVDVRFIGVTDKGTNGVDFSDVEQTDKVVLIGKITRNKQGPESAPCTDGGVYKSVTLSEVIVKRPHH